MAYAQGKERGVSHSNLEAVYTQTLNSFLPRIPDPEAATMGSYVSVETCVNTHKVAMVDKCRVNETDNGTRILAYGEYLKGEVPTDPDIAGVGILGIFLAVSAFALIAGILTLVLDFIEFWVRKKATTKPYDFDKNSRARNLAHKGYHRFHVIVREILDSFMMSCSDQQVFTGGAFALTLRYYRACLITAYHYNIIAGMLLLTCATHLLSIVLIRNYFKYWMIAVCRLGLIGVAFAATGMVLSNQNSGSHDEATAFPLQVPHEGEDDTYPFFRPAACFHADAENVVSQSWSSTFNHFKVFTQRPRSEFLGYIWGWPFYLAMLFYYCFTVLNEAWAFLRRGYDVRHRSSKRVMLMRTVSWKKQNEIRSMGWINTRRSLRFVYITLGVALASTVLCSTALYLYKLRHWAHNSGWLEVNEDIGGKNPENDWRTFGQLVPILVSAIAILGILQVINERLIVFMEKKRNSKGEGPKESSDLEGKPSNEPSDEADGQFPPTFPGNSSYDFGSGGNETKPAAIQTTEVLQTPEISIDKNQQGAPRSASFQIPRKKIGLRSDSTNTNAVLANAPTAATPMSTTTTLYAGSGAVLPQIPTTMFSSLGMDSYFPPQPPSRVNTQPAEPTTVETGDHVSSPVRANTDPVEDRSRQGQNHQEQPRQQQQQPSQPQQQPSQSQQQQQSQPQQASGQGDGGHAKDE
ncbi:hypothetical protein MKZ38_002781 [Zalerion maritima]|uniref:Uncharacterized protein n=1 Tax=Zalerion maritima TaxID=339359 RepID=A0AAD5RPS9_9PEZI|nr:hypothetical protein MKZ38_002781 [Zalerion maritima]